MSNITVGCKLPNGLTMSVGEKTVQLNGFMQNKVQIVGGYGITEDVPEDLFDAWVKANADKKIVIDELVFKQKNTKEAKAQAKDTAEKKSGLEQIDPRKSKEVEKLGDK